MSHTIEILAAQKADARNGEIIGLAFKNASIYCAECHYPENATEFDTDLHLYTVEKKTLHRVNRKIEKHYDHCNDRSCMWRRCSSCDSLKKERHEALRSAYRLRRNLRQNWPCATCIEMYNPTRRWNHPPKLTPIREEFINVRFD